MKIIGRIDIIDFPELGLEGVLAKIDSGANRSSIHCSHISTDVENGDEVLHFHIPLADSDESVIHKTSDYFKKRIRSSNGQVEDRFIIRTPIILFGKRIVTTFSLTDRKEMKYPVLLGRKLLKNRFLVDVSKENLSYQQKLNHIQK